MIFTENILFLHFPKTGGMMLTQQLLLKLKGKTYYSLPKGHLSPKEYALKILGRIKVIEGKRHETLAEANEILLKYKSKSLQDFNLVFVLIRNPYDFIVSRYHYLREAQKHNKQGKNMVLANSGNFDNFALNMINDYDIRDFILNDKLHIPSNLKIVKYEDMFSELNPFLQPYLSSPISFNKKINSSDHKEFIQLVKSKEVETAIYRRFKCLFELGYYERLKL